MTLICHVVIFAVALFYCIEAKEYKMSNEGIVPRQPQYDQRKLDPSRENDPNFSPFGRPSRRRLDPTRENDPNFSPFGDSPKKYRDKDQLSRRRDPSREDDPKFSPFGDSLDGIYKYWKQNHQPQSRRRDPSRENDPDFSPFGMKRGVRVRGRK